MTNGKCRMHGGASTGPKTPEGRARIAAARTIHGGYGAVMRAMRTRISTIVARGRVLQAVVRTGFPMEALAPLLQTVTHEKPDNTPYAVGPMWLLALPLTRDQGRRLVRMIRDIATQAITAQANNTPCTVGPPSLAALDPRSTVRTWPSSSSPATSTS